MLVFVYVNKIFFQSLSCNWPQRTATNNTVCLLWYVVGFIVNSIHYIAEQTSVAIYSCIAPHLFPHFFCRQAIVIVSFHLFSASILSHLLLLLSSPSPSLLCVGCAIGFSSHYCSIYKYVCCSHHQQFTCFI